MSWLTSPEGGRYAIASRQCLGWLSSAPAAFGIAIQPRACDSPLRGFPFGGTLVFSFRQRVMCSRGVWGTWLHGLQWPVSRHSQSHHPADLTGPAGWLLASTTPDTAAVRRQGDQQPAGAARTTGGGPGKEQQPTPDCGLWKEGAMPRESLGTPREACSIKTAGACSTPAGGRGETLRGDGPVRIPVRQRDENHTQAEQPRSGVGARVRNPGES